MKKTTLSKIAIATVIIISFAVIAAGINQVAKRFQNNADRHYNSDISNIPVKY
jgi:hypothetical protein